MMNKKKISDKFINLLKLELGSLSKGTLNSNVGAVILSGSDYLFKDSLSLSPLTVMLNCYNLLGLDGGKVSVMALNSVDLFFNDLNYLDNFVALRYNVSRNYGLVDRPYYSLNFFHLDNFPFYSNDFGYENYVLTLSQDYMLFKKFGSSNRPINNIFFYNKSSSNYLSKLNDYLKSFVLIKSFMSLLMDEERHYITFIEIVEFVFFVFVFIFLVCFILLHIGETIEYIYTNRYMLARTDPERFWWHVQQFIDNPVLVIKRFFWFQYINMKMILLAFYDAILLKYLRIGKLHKKYTFRFNDTNRKYKKYPDLFRKYFW